MDNLIIYSLVFMAIIFVCTSVALFIGLYRSKIDSDKVYRNVEELQEILNEILNIIKYTEELNMTKNNKLTLTDLIEQEPTEENYVEIIEVLKQLARKTYDEYKFLIAKSSNEKEQANFLQIVSNWDENPNLHKTLFKLAVDYGIETVELQKKFAEEVANNNVIELGDSVTVITDDGTGQPPTGVSPINSGLEGGEIAFIISFVSKENYDDFMEYNKPEEESKVKDITDKIADEFNALK